jgi:Ca2+-binding EF-hand superfamily protein
MPPGYSPAMPQLLTSVNLAPFGPTGYVASYAGFTEQGDYTLAVFAEDIDGVISLPRVLTITQPSDQFAEAPTAEQLRNDFNTLDVDQNGGLTLAEARALIPGLTSSLFNQLDDNGDGLLSLAELLDASVGEPETQTTVYVDFTFSGLELGTAANPFNTLGEGAAYVATAGELILSPGASPETPTLTRAMTLRAQAGPATIGAP